MADITDEVKDLALMQQRVRELGAQLAVFAEKAEQVRAERFVYLMALLQAGIEMEEHFGKKS